MFCGSGCLLPGVGVYSWEWEHVEMKKRNRNIVQADSPDGQRAGEALIETVEAHYAPTARRIDYLDGLSIEMNDWRFNLRMSNTEPVVRLNVESRADQALMESRTEELLKFMDR